MSSITTSMIENIHWFLPETFLAICSLLLLIVGVAQKEKEFASGAVSWLSIIVPLVAIFLIVFGMPFSQLFLFNGLVIVDHFTQFIKVIILLGAVIGVLYSMIDFEGQNAWSFELPLLILLSSLGMMIMVSAGNFMTFYIGLELQSLALYILAAFKRDTMRSTEAGMKYFVLGALASGFILYGASLLYGYTGSLDFVMLASVFSGSVSQGAILGMIFVLAGIAFKLSAAPFHMWAPDVYEGAPTAITAFFSMAPKIAALAILIRLLAGPLIGLHEQWQQIIILLSVASMVTGAFAALMQSNIKRLLAYSSIGHVGYMLMALVSPVAFNSEGISALLFYFVIYFFMTAGAFGVIIYLRNQNRSLETMDDLSGLSKDQPLMAVMMAVFMFSMAGIPPLAGFFGKFYVFQAVVNAGFYWLAITGVLTSVVAAYYYLRIVKTIYFDEPIEPTDVANSFLVRLVLYGICFVLLALVFDINSLYDLIRVVAQDSQIIKVL